MSHLNLKKKKVFLLYKNNFKGVVLIFFLLGKALAHCVRVVFTPEKRITRPVQDFFIRKFAHIILGITGTKVSIFYPDDLTQKEVNQLSSKTEGPYLYMSNHLSLIDIPAFIVSIPQSLRMVAKQELGKIPVFGKAIKKCGVILINRKNRKRAIAQLESSKGLISAGPSLWMAPEGTRNQLYNDMHPLGNFKRGGFYLAIDLGIPIVPFWIEGTQYVIPAKSMKINKEIETSVIFGRPIETRNMTKDNVNELITEVRNEMLRLRGLLPPL